MLGTDPGSLNSPPPAQVTASCTTPQAHVLPAPGISNEAQFVFTIQSIVMAQKLKGTLSFIAKVRGWVPQGSVMHPSSKALPRPPLPCAPSPCTPSAP